MYFLSGGSLNYEAGEDACETISPMEIGEDESKTLLEEALSSARWHYGFSGSTEDMPWHTATVSSCV